MLIKYHFLDFVLTGTNFSLHNNIETMNMTLPYKTNVHHNLIFFFNFVLISKTIPRIPPKTQDRHLVTCTFQVSPAPCPLSALNDVLRLGLVIIQTTRSLTAGSLIDCVWNVMAHAQKPDFVFRLNGRVHLNRPGGVSSVDYWQPRCAHQR